MLLQCLHWFAILGRGKQTCCYSGNNASLYWDELCFAILGRRKQTCCYSENIGSLYRDDRNRHLTAVHTLVRYTGTREIDTLLQWKQWFAILRRQKQTCCYSENNGSLYRDELWFAILGRRKQTCCYSENTTSLYWDEGNRHVAIVETLICSVLNR